MNTDNIFVRILIAVVLFALAIVLIPAILTELGAVVGSNLLLIIRICCAVIAVLYIVRGGSKGTRL